MFGYPRVQRAEKRLSKNLIHIAMFQVRYTSSNSFLHMLAACKDDFARSSGLNLVNDIQSTTFTFDASSNLPAARSSSQSTGYEFSDAAKSMHLGVTTDALTFSMVGKNYSTFDLVAEMFIKNVTPLLSRLEISEVSRISVRKINRVEVTGEKFSPVEAMKRVLNPVLVVSSLGLPCTTDLKASFGSFQAQHGDHRLICQYGFSPASGENLLPFVTLDIDALFDSNGTKVSEIVSRFTTLNEVVFDVFWWGISPNLLSEISEA